MPILLAYLFSKMLESRLCEQLISAQPVDQAAFRPEFGTIDHLFTLKIITETAYDLNIPIWIAAVDFKKAFDTISHASIWNALTKQGIDERYVDIFKKLYSRALYLYTRETREGSLYVLQDQDKGGKRGDGDCREERQESTS